MSDFIELTSPFDSNRKIFVKVSSVSCIESLAGHTGVYVEAASVSVQESAKEVIAKIEEWKKNKGCDLCKRNHESMRSFQKAIGYKVSPPWRNE